MQPTLFLIGGCNGAGKTTFARKYLPAAGISRFLNTDEIAKGLSPLDPALVAVKAGRLLLEDLHSLLEAGESFGLESTLSGKAYLRMVRTARERGYQIVLHYLLIPSSQHAVNRVAMRVKTGGHHVPDLDVARRFERSRTHFFEDYLPLADEWWVWDNSSPPPVLIADSKTCSSDELKRLMEGTSLMERPDLSHDEHTRIAIDAHRRATEEMMNYFMRMEIEVPEDMLNAEWKAKFADFKRKMAA